MPVMKIIEKGEDLQNKMKTKHDTIDRTNYIILHVNWKLKRYLVNINQLMAI